MNEGRLSVATPPIGARNVDARNSGITALARSVLTIGLLVVTLTGCGQRGPLTLPSAAPPASSPTPAS